MSNDSLDKFVENKLLLLVARVSMAACGILLPFAFGYITGLGNNVAALQVRVSVMETSQTNDQAATKGTLASIQSQMNDVQKQNINILQSIARLETKVNISNSGG